MAYRTSCGIEDIYKNRVNKYFVKQFDETAKEFTGMTHVIIKWPKNIYIIF